MDWTFAIERNREALKRILAMLVGMAGLVGEGAPTPRAISTARSCACCAPPNPQRGGWSSWPRAGWW